MTTFNELTPAPSDPPEPFTDQLRLAVAAYLARHSDYILAACVASGT
jgi:hypothetical protein